MMPSAKRPMRLTHTKSARTRQMLSRPPHLQVQAFPRIAELLHHCHSVWSTRYPSWRKMR